MAYQTTYQGIKDAVREWRCYDTSHSKYWRVFYSVMYYDMKKRQIYVEVENDAERNPWHGYSVPSKTDCICIDTILKHMHFRMAIKNVKRIINTIKSMDLENYPYNRYYGILEKLGATSNA